MSFYTIINGKCFLVGRYGVSGGGLVCEGMDERENLWGDIVRQTQAKTFQSHCCSSQDRVSNVFRQPSGSQSQSLTAWKWRLDREEEVRCMV